MDEIKSLRKPLRNVNIAHRERLKKLEKLALFITNRMGSMGFSLIVLAWTAPTGSMGTARSNHTATLLPDGTVLIAGGRDQNNGPLTSAEIYNPLTGMFTPTGSMHTAHFGHTATLLPSGKVLVAGGGNPTGVGIFVAELFDPLTGTFSLTGSMLRPRISYTATLLPNGEVLVTGSSTPGGRRCGGATASAELYH